MEELRIQFLKSFFLIFKATIKKLSYQDNIITGTIEWKNEGDEQDFSWFPEDSNVDLFNGKLLCDYLTGNKLINGDKVVISEKNLLSKLIDSGWDRDLAQNTIDSLCSVSVQMLDEGEETDSFFIHF